MYKKNILFLLIVSFAATPLCASDPNSNPNDDIEKMLWGIVTAVGLANLFTPKPHPKPQPQAPRPAASNRRQDALVQKAVQLFEQGDKNGLEGYLSYDLFTKHYRVFLPEDKTAIQNYFVQLEGFVRESVTPWEERERLAKKVRILRDKFNQEYVESQKKIDARLAAWNAGIVKPNDYVATIMTILDDVAWSCW